MTVVQVDDLMLSDESGFACSKTKLVDEGLPHLRPFNISDDGRLELGQVYQVPVVEAPPSKRELLPGDVLFNNTNSVELVGKAAIVREPLVAGFSNHLTRIRVDAKRVEPEYFALWLRRLRSTGFFTSQATQWVSQAAFRTAELRRLEIVLPGLEQQRRIVDLLARADGIVRLRREAQRKAAELIPAIFTDTFGDPATNSNQWPVSTLGEILAAADYGSSTKASSTGAGLPIIRMGNVTTAGDLDLDDLKYVELSDADAERFRLRKGDLLFNRTNSKELVGKTGLWDGSLDAVVASYFIRLRARLDVVQPTYLWAWMNSRHMKRVLFDTARGAIGQANINSRELRAFPVAVPPLKLQQAFDLRVQDIRAIYRQQQAAAIAATAVSKSLLARAFGGCD
jgi:type I restriction enzyme S subunit